MGIQPEYWLDVRNLKDLKTVIGERIQLAKSYGCDGILPDHIDCFENQNCWETMRNPIVSKGSDVKYANIAFSTWMATYAHELNMIIGQKNAVYSIPDLVSFFDFSVNEQCVKFKECDKYAPYIEANKAVFGHEYT